jgi:hypothetical protein
VVAPEARVVIASRTGLVALAAIAVALAIVVAIGGRGPQVVDRSLVPGLDVDAITSVRFNHGDQAIEIFGDNRRAALDKVFTALRGGRWHRRSNRATAGAPRTRVTIFAGDRTVQLDIGAALAGTNQTWIAREGDAVLVDDWIAAALDLDRIDLVDRQPLASAGTSEILRVDSLELRGHPRRLAGLVTDAGLVHALEVACAAVEITAVASQPADAHPDATVALDHVVVDGVGPCDGKPELELVLRKPVDAGCVDRARWQAVLDAAAALRRPPEQIVERRPVPIDPKQLVLADGGKVDRTKRPQIDGHDADPDRVAELIAALAAPAEPVALPQGKPSGSIVAGDFTLDLYDRVLARRGEPVALRPTREAWAIITRVSSALREPTRWIEEPTTISQITIDGTTYTRGASLGAWTGARDSALVDAAVTAIATLRAPTGPAPARIEHKLELVVTPPAGPPITHRLELGSQCAARADGQPVTLPLAACTAVIAAAGR